MAGSFKVLGGMLKVPAFFNMGGIKNNNDTH